MFENAVLSAATGGAIIGVASVMLLWLNGRIAGISGMVNGVFARNLDDIAWRAMFLIGLIAGGLLYMTLSGETLITRDDYPAGLTIIAGLLVGFGTRMGSGCTSGHGVCGISRLSMRSVVATAVFVVVGIITATSIHLLRS